MKKTSSELKSMAKELLIGHYGLAIGAAILINSLSSVFGSILNIFFPEGDTFTYILLSIAVIILKLLFSLFTAGITKIFLNISHQQKASLNDLFYAFSHRPDKVIIINFLLGLLGLVCMLPSIVLFVAGYILDDFLFLSLGGLLCVVGIVAIIILTLNYSQVFFLYLDHPETDCLTLLRESRRLMNGNKRRYFYLLFSFTGLILLGTMSYSIGLLWVTPYMGVTEALFYRNLIGEI